MKGMKHMGEKDLERMLYTGHSWGHGWVKFLLISHWNLKVKCIVNSDEYMHSPSSKNVHEERT